MLWIRVVTACEDFSYKIPNITLTNIWSSGKENVKVQHENTYLIKIL